MKSHIAWKLVVTLAFCLVDGVRLPHPNIASITFPIQCNTVEGNNRGAIALAVTRQFALHNAVDFAHKNVQEIANKTTGNSEIDDAISFYAAYQDRILRELLLPAVNAVSKGRYAESSKPRKVKNVEWDIAVSTPDKPLQCAVLASVPPGTILVRPKPGPGEVEASDYISIMALNDIVRSQPSSLSLLFPSAQPSEVYKLYAHASLPTILVAYLSCSKFFRRALSALLITSVAAAAHQMILDLLIALLRTRTFWHPHVYGLWSRIYHTPVPLLALTAKRIAELSYDAFVSVEEYLHRCGIDLESHMLNADLYRHTLRRKVIKNHMGLHMRYEPVFSGSEVHIA